MKIKMLYDNEVINDSLTEHPIIKKLINHDLKSLDRQKFIIFPQHINESNDLKEDNMIFQSRNGKIWTCNVVRTNLELILDLVIERLMKITF